MANIQHLELKGFCQQHPSETLQQVNDFLESQPSNTWQVIYVQCDHSQKGQPRWLSIILVRVKEID